MSTRMNSTPAIKHVLKGAWNRAAWFLGAAAAGTAVTWFALSAGGSETVPATRSNSNASPSTTLNRQVVGSTFLASAGAATLDSLAKGSHVIVVGTVREAEIIERPTYIDNPSAGIPVDERNAGKEQPAKVPVSFSYRTSYTVDIETLVKSDNLLSPDAGEIRVTDLGAIEDSTAYIFGESPVYQVGGRYLFFLLRHPRDESRLVTAVGRYSQFVIEGDSVRQGDGIFPLEPSEVSGAAAQLDGLSVEGAVSRIASILTAVR